MEMDQCNVYIFYASDQYFVICPYNSLIIENITDQLAHLFNEIREMLGR